MRFRKRPLHNDVPRLSGRPVHARLMYSVYVYCVSQTVRCFVVIVCADRQYSPGAVDSERNAEKVVVTGVKTLAKATEREKIKKITDDNNDKIKTWHHFHRRRRRRLPVGSWLLSHVGNRYCNA